MSFAGEGDLSVAGEITGCADVWDACGKHISWAELKRTDVPAGRRVITPGGVAADTMTGVVPVRFFENDSERFFSSLMSVEPQSVAGPSAVGRAVIQWTVCGETPREGMIQLVTTGTCKLAPPGEVAHRRRRVLRAGPMKSRRRM